MEYVVKSDVGKIREINEDSYLVLEGDTPIFVVADGMGGHKAGEVASAMAIDVFRQYHVPERRYSQNVNRYYIRG